MAKHILVVDDNSDAAELLATVLEHEQPRRFTCSVACDGQQAVDAALTQVLDTVVMDIEMPVMDGVTAARVLRQSAPTASAHLIAVSGRSDYVEQVRRHETAFNDGMLRPVDVDDLVKLIDAGPDKP